MDNLLVKEYLKQGLVYSSQGKYEEAIGYYEKAEKENPMEIEVYLSKGVAYANLGKLDEAQAQFEKALKINRNSGIVYYHLGSIALMKNEVEIGIENYNKAIAHGFEDAQLYYSLGLLHEESGESDLAIRNYSKAIMKNPMRSDIRIRKAQILLQTNHLPEALQTLDELILSNPDVFEGYHIKFMILVQLKQYDKASEVINNALSLFPKDPGFALDKVTLAIEQGNIDSAKQQLNELEKSDEADDAVRRRIFMEKAQIFARENNLNEAISSLSKAKELSEKAGRFDSEVVFLLANCYMGHEDYEKLLQCSNELIEKSEDDYSKNAALYFKPYAIKRMGNNDEAYALYKEAIEEFRRQALEMPGNLDAYMLRIMCLKDIEEYDKALELIEYVIGLSPERPEPRIVKISILESQGQKDKAKEEEKILNALLPESLRKKR